MTDIEQLDKCISWHFVAGTISREARDAWNRILAERSADKARIAAAEGVAAELRAYATDAGKCSDIQTMEIWANRLSQPADPNSSTTQQKDENWQPSWPDFVKAVDALVMRSGDEFDCCSWQEITSRISALQGIAKEMHELADNWPHVKYSADLDARAAAILGDRCYQPDKPLASESGEQVEVVGYWDGESEVFSKSVDSGPDDEPLVYKSDYDALRAEHAAIAADLLATAQRYHERAIAAERKLDAYRVAVREMFLMVEQYSNFNPAAAWLSARVAEIVGGANGR